MSILCNPPPSARRCYEDASSQLHELRRRRGSSCCSLQLRGIRPDNTPATKEASFALSRVAFVGRGWGRVASAGGGTHGRACRCVSSTETQRSWPGAAWHVGRPVWTKGHACQGVWEMNYTILCLLGRNWLLKMLSPCCGPPALYLASYASVQ